MVEMEGVEEKQAAGHRAGRGPCQLVQEEAAQG